MRDEWSGSRGLCAGVSTVNPRKGPACGEVTSLTTDPNRTWNPVTRHPHSSNSATASWGSLGWRVFIQKDVLQLCLDWPGLLLQETLEGEVFQMFQVVQHSTWKPLVLYQEITYGNPSQPRAVHTRPVLHWEPSLGSATGLHLHMWGRGLEGRFSLWAGAGWWARGDLGVLSRSHLRTGWQWRSGIPEVLCSVPVWTQGWQVVGHLRLRWSSVQRVVGVCLDLRCL